MPTLMLAAVLIVFGLAFRTPAARLPARPPDFERDMADRRAVASGLDSAAGEPDPIARR